MTLLHARHFKLFLSSVTLLQRFQTILVFSDPITVISDYFGLHWLYHKDFKLFLSSVTLLQGFQTNFVFTDSIKVISGYFCLQWFYYRTFRLFLSSENWYSQTCLNCLRILRTLLVFTEYIMEIPVTSQVNLLKLTLYKVFNYLLPFSRNYYISNMWVWKIHVIDSCVSLVSLSLISLTVKKDKIYRLLLKINLHCCNIF